MMYSDYQAPPATPHLQLIPTIESDNRSIVLRPNRLGLGYRLADGAEGFGPTDVENEIIPRVGRRGAVLGTQRETESDVYLPIIVKSTSSQEIRRLVADMTEVFNRANGMFKIMLTDPATGVTTYRRVAYREGLRSPEWMSPQAVKYSITADYVDPWAYSNHTEQVTLEVAPAATGGVTFPLRFPVRFNRSALTTDRLGTNNGSNPAPVSLRFNGPVTDPEIELVGLWRFAVRGTLQWDEYLVIDPMDSTATVYSTTGRNPRSAYNMMSVGSRFTDLEMPPGTHPFVFRALDDTYTATVEATWPHTYSGMI